MKRKLDFTKRFVKQYRKLPKQIQQLTDQKLALLAHNLAHPSLRVKKVKSTRGVLEGSININYRFTFQLEGDVLVMRKIGPHDIIENP